MDTGLSLMKEEMQAEEIHLRVNAIHRLKTVILSHSESDFDTHIEPYLNEIVKSEDDEVLFAVAEEIGLVFGLV